MKRMVLAIVVLLASTIPAQAILISVDPSQFTISQGNSLTVDINISGLGTNSAPSLSAFDIDLGFDPAILSFISASYGDPLLGDQLDLSSFGTLTYTNPGTATVNLYELSFDDSDTLNSTQADSFTLARLIFGTIGTGISDLDLTVNDLVDAADPPDWLDSTVQNARVRVNPSVAPVPEPSTFLLICSGVLAMVGLKKKLRS